MRWAEARSAPSKWACSSWIRAVVLRSGPRYRAPRIADRTKQIGVGESCMPEIGSRQVAVFQVGSREIGSRRLACDKSLSRRFAWLRRVPSSRARSRSAPASFAWRKSAWHRSAR